MKASDSATPDAAASEQITGSVENIVYRSEDTGYTVCAVRVAGRKDPITVVGNCAALWQGETLQATGSWVNHRQHGLQFQAESIVCIVPTSASGIERYLAGGMIRGVGKVMAQRIVKTFGAKTLDIIEKESSRLEEISGIGPHRRQMIRESWMEKKAIRDIMIFLQGHGVGTAQSARIFRYYGNQSIAVISENPYRLCNDVWGIGFKTADKVALNLGIPAHSSVRARAGLLYVLQTLQDEGHCHCPVAELLLQAQTLLEIPTEILAEALQFQIAEHALIQEEDRIYPRDLFRAECRVCEKLKTLIETERTFPPIKVEQAVKWAEARMGITFAPQQSDTLQMALREKVAIITGGPGVGKTTIIRALVDVFHARQLRVSLAAPTGRAAKRMEESTRHEAMTLHRLLKYNPQMANFEHGPDNPLEGDVFILDEASMIDLPLMAHFVSALEDHSCLILVGDMDQLPSVGPGNVLRDLIHSDVIPSQRLTHIFRQASEGLIVRNAHHVNNGEFIESPERGGDSDFYFIDCEDPEMVIRRMLDLVTDRIPNKFGFDARTEVQVLTPMRKNQLGADNLNTLLQEALNPSGPAIQRFGRKYRVGDRVMQIRNNYDKDVFNGDVGLISRIDEEEQVVTVTFDGRAVPFDFAELDELVHAYACSIHKSQGSEYPAVVVLLATQHYRLLQRNLLYTALTRGRKLVCLVGSSRAVAIAIHNNSIRLRRTTLQQRLVATMRK